MKKIITIFDIRNIKELSKYADGFIIGSDKFSTRLTKSFSIDEINEIISLTKSLDKEVFLNVNQMFTDKQLESFELIFKNINYKDLTGIVVADLGTMILLNNLGLNNKIIYNPETLLTNEIDFNFLSTDNILGAYIAKEITVDNILSIGLKKKYKMFIVGHGHLNMFYSKRHLLDSYKEFIGKEESYDNLQTLKIIEPKRDKTPFPIFQDKAGTHVFRSKVMNSFDYLDKLNQVVDYFVIDTLFKDDVYGLEILKLYNNFDEEKVEKIKENYKEQWDNGFLDNKTYYKRKVKND